MGPARFHRHQLRDRVGGRPGEDAAPEEAVFRPGRGVEPAPADELKKKSAVRRSKLRCGRHPFSRSSLASADHASEIGISFYTFHGHLVPDRRVSGSDRSATKTFSRFGLYLSLFPHLIAGPIVRYCDIAGQLAARPARLDDLANGIRRFIVGLGKKVLIGNTVALAADSIMQLPPGRLTTPLAWLGIFCYTLQIYYDFSGYSDMAIGLARMFGFTFPENFNYPYISRSITEFWKRWHITLSTWLRDYLFFPLGIRGPRSRLYRNVLIVFTLCGLWHGASWHFVAWGVFQGLIMVAERMWLLKLLDRLPRAFGHAYALLAIVTGWALFRAESLRRAFAYIGAMFGRAGHRDRGTSRHS